ncbi:MAG: non-canonical purine NTP pyrophosphatase [Chloracidobacterium sp.]|nr:non-canonical purine NTP pyrophosphatase [Chloracidobacterium sp.]
METPPTSAQYTLPTLLIATSNKGKVSEIAALLEGLDCRIIGIDDLPKVTPPVEETGTTFVENALIKADHYHTATGLLTLAEDSGLEVDALDGRPGVYSARYGGERLSGADQIVLLLEEMKDAPEEKRTARFISVVALVGKTSYERSHLFPPDGGFDTEAGTEIRKTFEGRCEGKIAFAPRGLGGFGYDPIFIDTELDRTFAELSPQEKSSRSHRGKALKAAVEYLEKLFEEAKLVNG